MVDVAHVDLLRAQPGRSAAVATANEPGVPHLTVVPQGDLMRGPVVTSVPAGPLAGAGDLAATANGVMDQMRPRQVSGDARNAQAFLPLVLLYRTPRHRAEGAGYS